MSLWLYILGNKANRKISKRVFQKTKHAKFSEKSEHFSPSNSHTYMCLLGDRIALFSENLAALFSCNIRFDSRAFALLPTIYAHWVKSYESSATATYYLSFPVVSLQSLCKFHLEVMV